MGLTISYSLKSKVRKPERAKEQVEQLRQAALDLPFASVSDITEITDVASISPEVIRTDAELRWLMIQAERTVRVHVVADMSKCIRVAPEHIITFSAYPGDGCEVMNIGLCRYPKTINGRKTGLSGWSWSSFCKTQYASDPEYGGIENFLRCHISVIKLLDVANKLGIIDEVRDEGEFWLQRDMAVLATEVGLMNVAVAGLVGTFKDLFGNDFDAPIKNFQNFEHLEAKAQK